MAQSLSDFKSGLNFSVAHHHLGCAADFGLSICAQKDGTGDFPGVLPICLHEVWAAGFCVCLQGSKIPLEFIWT